VPARTEPFLRLSKGMRYGCSRRREAAAGVQTDDCAPLSWLLPSGTLPHRRRGSSPVSSIAARLDLDEFPVEKRKDIDEPGRTKAIGPHTLGDHSRQVPRDVPVWAIDWFQDDFDGVVHLGQRAADDLHLPSTIAQGDESPVALEGAGDPRRADDDGRQHHHGHLDVRQRPAPVSGCQRYPDGGAPWLWWPSPRSCLLM
jgi:hypothetical protein